MWSKPNGGLKLQVSTNEVRLKEEKFTNRVGKIPDIPHSVVFYRQSQIFSRSNTDSVGRINIAKTVPINGQTALNFFGYQARIEKALTHAHLNEVKNEYRGWL